MLRLMSRTNSFTQTTQMACWEFPNGVSTDVCVNVSIVFIGVSIGVQMYMQKPSITWYLCCVYI